jgi:hypothetical protein
MKSEPRDDDAHDDALDDEQLILGDLLNHVLDKGVVITGSVTISVADIDLLMVDLRLVLSGIDRSLDRAIGKGGP